jgi:SAM-dependent methyltransferase
MSPCAAGSSHLANVTIVADRRRLLLRGIDPTHSRGLELGPLTSPVVTRDLGVVHYLDHVDTDALRRRYASHDGFDIEAIVEIDHVLDPVGSDGTIRAAVGGAAPFDYVVASHVVEHVPDLVAWLADIRGVLCDGGVLALAVPDHRRCFDALRSPTVPADVVQAYLAHAIVPTPRQVYDHYASAVAWHGHIAWNEEPPFAELVPVHSEAEAFERAATIARTGEYQDVHCWVFTPESFRVVLEALHRHELLPFRIDHASDTVGGEFFATLVADGAPCTADVAMSVIDQRRSGSASVRAELAEVRAELEQVRAERDAILASRVWRVAGMLRHPLRRPSG